jgi:hypothetical protein
MPSHFGKVRNSSTSKRREAVSAKCFHVRWLPQDFARLGDRRLWKDPLLLRLYRRWAFLGKQHPWRFEGLVGRRNSQRSVSARRCYRAASRWSVLRQNKPGEGGARRGKKIQFKWWRIVELEDRRTYINSSDVLRPTQIPADPITQAYVQAMKHQPVLRTPPGTGELKIFSSDEGRELLEQQFLAKGAYIRTVCPMLNEYQRPLGNMVLETLGFGSTIVTFRNCPNNAPLVFWAGDPWHPLFLRKTN